MRLFERRIKLSEESIALIPQIMVGNKIQLRKSSSSRRICFNLHLSETSGLPVSTRNFKSLSVSLYFFMFQNDIFRPLICKGPIPGSQHSEENTGLI